MKDNFISKIKAHFLMKRVLKNRKRVGKTYSRLTAYFLTSILSWEYNNESDIRDLKEMLNCYDANIKEAELILLSNYRNRIKRHESSKTVICDPDQSIAEQVKEFQNIRNKEKDQIKEAAQTNKILDKWKIEISLAKKIQRVFEDKKKDGVTSIEINEIISIIGWFTNAIDLSDTHGLYNNNNKKIPESNVDQESYSRGYDDGFEKGKID